MSGATAPDGIEPVVAWRAWRVERDPSGTTLRSITRATRWPIDRPLAAACSVGRCRVPVGEGCQCGIYGMRRPQDITVHTVSLPAPAEIVAFGLVELWGRVVEGELGWRASVAAPRLIVLPSGHRRETRDLLVTALELSDYGVPVEVLDLPRAAITGEVMLHGTAAISLLRRCQELAEPTASVYMGPA